MLFTAIIILLFTSVFLYLSVSDKKEHLEKNIQFKNIELDLLFTKKTFELQNLYHERLEELVNNDKLIDAFAKRDRDTLDRLAQKEFEKLKKENRNFEVICFALPDMKSFYRAHLPSRYGDDISKVHGVKTVTMQKKRVSGFLIAKLGLFYRVTFPVFKDGEYIGLIAYGVSLDYVNDYIHNTMDTESAVLVDTKELKQSRWFDMLEEGSLGEYTIISTNGELIDTLKSSGQNFNSDTLQISKNGKTYNVVKRDIKGINDKSVAKIILFQDITREIHLYNSHFYTFIVVVILLVILLLFVLVKTFNKFLTTIVVINDDLKDLNKNLEVKVKEELDKNREKDLHLLQQAKNAALGEMIASIAHQWRQPLSIISTAATGTRFEKEYGLLNDEQLTQRLDQINETAQHLSKTIDDFRDFLRDDRAKIFFNLTKEIEKCLLIEEAIIKQNSITVIKSLDDTMTIESLPHGLSHSIINLINNAKDAMVTNMDEDNRYLFIESKRENDIGILTLKDSGGGIDEEILDKIFDPYFTTKHQSQGTGLGLYMSYKIITEKMNGTLQASNVTYEYKERIYTGAEFTITLSLSE